MLENIHDTATSLWNIFRIISGKFLRAEIKLFQTDVDEGWNKFEIMLPYFTRNHGNALYIYFISHTKQKDVFHVCVKCVFCHNSGSTSNRKTENFAHKYYQH